MSKDTILILDDDFHILWTLKTFLAAEGYTVKTVDTIEKFLKISTVNKISIFLIEYRVQGSKTLEAIVQAKQFSPEAYVMMITNNQVGEEEYQPIIKAGVDDFFLKPFPNYKILLHLEKGIRQRNLFLQNQRLEQELIHCRQGACFSEPLTLRTGMSTPGTNFS
jgi:DNA-binding NtrC family response regulator